MILFQSELTEVLSHIGHYGSIVQELLDFIETTVQTSTSQSTDTPGVTQTYQAFASALSTYMQQLNAELVKLEKKISNQGKIA